MNRRLVVASALLFALAVLLWPSARAEVRKLFEVARSFRSEAATSSPPAAHDREPPDPSDLSV